jgi:hypothetical protein
MTTQGQITIQIENATFRAKYDNVTPIISDDNTAVGNTYHLFTINVNGFQAIKVIRYFSGENVIILQDSKHKKSIVKCNVLA